MNEKKKKKGLPKRILSYVLTLAMVLTLMPGMSMEVKAGGGIEYISRSWDEGEVKSTTKTCSEYTSVTDETTTFEESKWYVVEGEVSVFERISVEGTANLILMDGAKLTAENGINVEDGKTLNIYGQSNGNGQLIASGSDHETGIGGGHYEDGGTVTIYGGSITATGGYCAAGIGGGDEGLGGTVTIYGGSITALGGAYGAGIGGGDYKAGGTVTIYGGSITATGGAYAAGIGGSETDEHGELYILNDKLSIKAGDDLDNLNKTTLEDYLDNRNTLVKIMPDHVHEFTYSKENASTIIITCNCDNETEFYDYCYFKDAIEESEENRKIKLILSSDEDTYFKKIPANAIKIKTESYFGEDLDIKELDDFPTIKYQGTGTTEYELSEEKPTEIGTYKAVITIKEYSAEVNFELKPLPPITYIERSWDETLNKVIENPVTLEEYSLVDSEIESFEDGGWYVVMYDTTVSDRIYVDEGTANLILMDGAKLTAKNGIDVENGKALNIYGQSSDSGKLIATSYDYAAGIGGDEESGGTVTIHGGNITAMGGESGAGIGGGDDWASGGTVTIYGGCVSATGRGGGTGIGGGAWTDNHGKLDIKIDTPSIKAGDDEFNLRETTIEDYLENRYSSVKIMPNHVHKFSYSKENATTIIATCNCDNNTELYNYCYYKDAIEASEENRKIKLTLSSDEDNYFGKIPANAIKIKTESYFGEDFDINELKDLSAIKYQGTGTTEYALSEKIPTEIGTYKAVITIKEYSAEVNFELKPLPPITYIERSWDETLNKVIENSSTNSTYSLVDSDTQSFEDGGWYVVMYDVTVPSRISVEGAANLILMDGAKLTAEKGIDVGVSKTLNIYGQTNDTGNLIATASDYAAGIGGSQYAGAGSINIYGGTVTADAPRCSDYIYGGTAIGGGNQGQKGDLVVYGGIINASAYTNTAINCDTTINGGKVTATGGSAGVYGGAGIGTSDRDAEPTTIVIRGGEVTATGAGGGAGIGDCLYGCGSHINISAGKIIATGATGGAGIGGSSNGNESVTIIISGGDITATGGKDLGSGYGAGIGKSADAENDSIITLSEGVSFQYGMDETSENFVGYEDGDVIYNEKLNNNIFAKGGRATHVHSFIYSVQDDAKNMIVATCSNEDGNCDIDNGTGAHKLSLTLTATSQNYSGSAVSASFGSGEEDSWKSVLGNDKVPTIMYALKKSDGTYETATSTAPVNAGTYRASITAVDDNTKTATKDFEITKESQDAPTAGSGFTIDYASETILAGAGYEVSTSDTALTAPSNNKVTPGATYYIRKKGDANHAPSAWTSNTLAARPTAPAGYKAVDPTKVGGADGKITDVTSAMEYSTDNGTTWTAVKGTEITGLAAGTVLLRVKATDHAFASASVEVMISDLNQAKADANSAIEAEVGSDTSANVKKAADDAKKAIDKATTIDGVTKAKEAGIKAIKAAKKANADAKALAKAKTAAKAAIDKEVGFDTSDNVKKAANDAKKAINKASTIDGVSKAKASGIAAIKAAKKANEEELSNELALAAKFSLVAGKKISVTWGKVSDATGYDVYMSYCGSDPVCVKSTTARKATIKKLNKKAIDQKKAVQCYVVAYKKVNGKKVTIAKTFVAYAAGKRNETATDAVRIKLSKIKYVLAKKKTATIKATTVKANKELPLLTNVAEFRYASSNSNVATVSEDGKITAVGKGTCYVYVYAVNGCARKITVTVK